MAILIIVDNPNSWPFHIKGVQVVAAREYLTDPQYSQTRGTKVFNLCRSYRYQSVGYYVSLLAAARGQRPLPDITTIQDMKSQTIIRFVSDELDEIIGKVLAPLQSTDFTLSIYFGRNLAKRYDRLSLHLFNLFPAPLLRAHFVLDGDWQLQSITAIPASEIPEEHHDFVVQAATDYFAGRRATLRKRTAPRYDLAILHNPSEPNPPSNEAALQKFAKAAESLGMGVELIQREDYGRVAEFDALFIRETTAVNHHTYRFARRAVAEGLVVVDDPESILKCTNKVYMAELLDRRKIPIPKTVILHRDNLDAIVPPLGLPCILKQPDSSFSEGVVKVDSEEELQREGERLLEKSELVIAQEFIPTTFDWRVGIFERRPLYVCKYFMARRHWQIINRNGMGRERFGRYETLFAELAPRRVVRTALAAANLMGDGLYGVDVKESDGRLYVIEINDNPNVDAGVEDAVLKDELYLRIMEGFLRRVERMKEGSYRR